MKLSFKYRVLIQILNLISKTWRYEVHGTYPEDKGIVAFWHGYMLPVWKFFAKYHPTAIVSQSKDGEILSTLLTYWGFQLARGSSSKGGKEALDLIVEKAKNKLVLITPDGPRGPYKEFKSGAVVASFRSQTILFLCNVKIINKFIFKKSWDKFELPLPFSKIILRFNEPIKIAEDSSREQIDDIITKCQMILNNEE